MATNNIPTGSVVFTGTASQGQELTATNDIKDADGIGALTYQWMANGVDISGATFSTLMLTQSLVGKVITVKASYTDSKNTFESISSTQNVMIANVNDSPTGSVAISGTPTQGQSLSATNSLADADGLGVVSYKWLAGGAEIAGATTSTLTLTQAQVGKVITVKASYTDAGNTPESVMSNATTEIVNVNDAPTGNVVISGKPEQGQVLTASNTLGDADGLGTVSYKWLADGVEILGATTSAYTLTQAQVGKVIYVKANYIDGGNTPESIASTQTVAVTNVNDSPTGSVAISGTPTQGQTLTATNTLADLDGLGVVSYKWLSGGAEIAGATTSSLTLTQAQVGKVVTVKANYTDAGNTLESVISNATSVIANVNDAPTGTVTIAGVSKQGQILTASNTLGDIDGLGTVSYKWYADDVEIPSATDSTLALTKAQTSKKITVKASYTDGGSTMESVTSNPTNLVEISNNLPTGDVIVEGTIAQGETLKAFNNLKDVDGMPKEVSYQWLAEGKPIFGAVDSTFVIGQGQVGKIIAVRADYTDNLGNKESVVATKYTAKVEYGPNGIPLSPVVEEGTSSPPIAGNTNDRPTGVVTIVGRAIEGVTLSINNTIADADGLGEMNYLWLRDGAAISGATTSTYKLTQADVNKAMSVKASYTDKEGTNESLTSVETVKVENTNNSPVGDVIITGKTLPTETLIASHTLNDTDGMGDVTYIWQRDGVTITDIQQDMYALTLADAGKKITVQASYTDLSGAKEVVLSKPIAVDTVLSIKASAGKDFLLGTVKGDKLSSLDGDDTLVGGLGRDTLKGGTGADLFKFNLIDETGITSKTRDTISDFKRNEGDRIDLSSIDASDTLTGNQAFTFIGNNVPFGFNATGQLRFDVKARVLYGSTDADTAPEFSILLSGVSDLVPKDFIL
jgi:TusA-related sulfurtransferase